MSDPVSPELSSELMEYARGTHEHVIKLGGRVNVLDSKFDRLIEVSEKTATASTELAAISKARLTWEKEKQDQEQKAKAASDARSDSRTDKLMTFFTLNWKQLLAGAVIILIAVLHPDMLPKIWEVYFPSPALVSAPLP